MKSGGAYFASPDSAIAFIPSGCTLLDCALGGGWAMGRVINLVGDKSTGKTLLCIEACANFIQRYPEGKIYYRERESAFDKSYAQALGMPVDRIDFGGEDDGSVEAIFEDMSRVLAKHRKGKPGLYIVDSLDALSDRNELKRAVDQPSYGGDKAKMISKLFRELNSQMNKANICIVFVSQIRDNIGAMFGKKYKRSGGHALDFYASQVVYLAHIKTLTKIKKGVKRAVGVRVRAKVDKNKVGLPFREAEFDIQFGYGIDDAGAALDWLKEVNRLDVMKTTKNKVDEYRKDMEKLDDNRYKKRLRSIARRTRKVWSEIETTFLPKRKKY